MREQGIAIPPFLGTATTIYTQRVGDMVATTGDFALLADEVDPVINALITHNLYATAINSHLLHESPHLFFLHFWGYGNAQTLAAVLKKALEKINLAM